YCDGGAKPDKSIPVRVTVFVPVPGRGVRFRVISYFCPGFQITVVAVSKAPGCWVERFRIHGPPDCASLTHKVVLPPWDDLAMSSRHTKPIPNRERWGEVPP